MLIPSFCFLIKPEGRTYAVFNLFIIFMYNNCTHPCFCTAEKRAVRGIINYCLRSTERLLRTLFLSKKRTDLFCLGFEVRDSRENKTNCLPREQTLSEKYGLVIISR